MRLNDRFMVTEEEIELGDYPDSMICGTCAAFVADVVKHHEWHNELEVQCQPIASK